MFMTSLSGLFDVRTIQHDCLYIAYVVFAKY